ncbi:MAG: hypothetical protein IOB85_06410 [Methylobacterium sp.]|nr:hypothetical protein [Methylobacterium sp.]MCA3662098.1 hypothetical protein [Methylobacterium sp.]MCA3662425.1 hypothetical protein [Methylobacterium sp.]MCA3666024.1 hypothetical protein [Methylobacterium sp.]MCA3672538.1 hypothetical protein [Methylobacterium sp.]
MKHSFIIPARFTFSPAAIAAIERIRADWQAQFGDHPEIVSVAWGLYDFDNGKRGEGVIVSFYTREQRAEMAEFIQIVSGLETIFFTIRRYAPHFDGKVIDFSNERFFFLRAPA